MREVVDCYNKNTKPFCIEIRIPYSDTDRMGAVYYANYFIYFERARTEWLRHQGLIYKDIEERGIFLPVVECWCSYLSPIHYDDVITIETFLSDLGYASLEFFYIIKRNDKILTKAKTKHPFVNRDFKPIRIPQDIREILELKCLKRY